jgi:hypothetical protein
VPFGFWRSLWDLIPLEAGTSVSTSVADVLMVRFCCEARSRPRLPLRVFSLVRELDLDAALLARWLEVLERVRGAKYSSPACDAEDSGGVGDMTCGVPGTGRWSCDEDMGSVRYLVRFVSSKVVVVRVA